MTTGMENTFKDDWTDSGSNNQRKNQVPIREVMVVVVNSVSHCSELFNAEIVGTACSCESRTSWP